MKEFILKLKRLEVRLIKKILMLRELQKMAQAIPREFFDDTEPEQTGAGTKRPGDSFEHSWRKRRKSARPKFLAG